MGIVSGISVFYFGYYDDGQHISSERHSMSLVGYPEALCSKAWAQMNLMANFNEDVSTALGHYVLTDRSPFAQSSGC